jgi:tetratricopeptide (TPR) repeat protein
MYRSYPEVFRNVLAMAVAVGALALAGCSSAPSATDMKGEASETAVATTGAPADPAAALPPEAVQQFDKAVVHMSAGDLAAAEQGFLALSTAYPSYSGPLLNLGILQVRAGRFEDAEKTLRAATERNPENAAAFNQLGIAYRKLGRFKDADAAYQRAVQIDPQYALAWLNLGVLCDLYLQQPERALEAYERYLALAQPPDAKVNSWVTELKKRIGSEPRSARAQ